MKHRPVAFGQQRSEAPVNKIIPMPREEEAETDDDWGMLVVTNDEYLEGSGGEEEVFEENESEANENGNGSEENEAGEEDSDNNGEYLEYAVAQHMDANMT